MLDDLWTRILQSNEVSQVTQEVGKMFANRATEEFVKIIDPPKGNLTPAQIAQGMTGEPPPGNAIQPSQQYQAQAMLSNIGAAINPKMVALVGAGLIGLFLLTGKSGGK